MSDERDLFAEEKPVDPTEQKKARELEFQDLRTVLSTPSGGRLIYRILEFSRPLANAFTGDDASTFFNLGQQNVGQWLTKEIYAVKPEFFTRNQTKRGSK